MANGRHPMFGQDPFGLVAGGSGVERLILFNHQALVVIDRPARAEPAIGGRNVGYVAGLVDGQRLAGVDLPLLLDGPAQTVRIF